MWEAGSEEKEAEGNKSIITETDNACLYPFEVMHAHDPFFPPQVTF